MMPLNGTRHNIASSSSPSILLLEDDMLVADAVADGLTEEGLHVTLARDGRAGGDFLARDNWSAIILDWWLPYADGLTLLKQLRNRGSEIPVLFLTARDAVSDRVNALNAGADDYLCKPFAFDELVARVRALVRRSTRSDAGKLEFEDVAADLIARRAVRAGSPLTLNPKSFDLLAYFLRKPNISISRRELTEEVWHEAFHPASRTVDVQLVELRRELERHGSRLIHTCRGLGYRLSLHPAE